MLINNNGINSNNLGSSSKLHDNAEVSSKANKATTAGSEADSVNLSAAAHSLSRLEAAVNDSSDINTNRVDAIRQAIEDGSYSIDAEAIATGLLASDALN